MSNFFYINQEKAPDVYGWIKDKKIKSDRRIVRSTKRIVVGGGDGTLLRIIPLYYERELPFFGINRGTKGFLMNPVKTLEEFIEAIKSYTCITLNLLRVRIILRNGKFVDTVAFNDAYVKSMLPQSGVRGTIKCFGDFEQGFDGDGIIVATPQGSTAYTRSADGHMLSLKDRVLGVTSICGQTEKIRKITVANEIEIIFSRGKAYGIADNKVVKDIAKMEISIIPDAVQLAFMKGYDFDVVRYKSLQN